MTSVALTKGEQLPDRSSTYTDPDTGATVHQLTSDDSINHSFFFLNPSFRPGHEDQLGFVTHRGDKPQICLHDGQTGRSTCLTDREGVHAFSPVFSPDGKCIFYTTNTAEVWRIDLDSLSEDCLATLEGAGLGEAGASPDGRYIVTACKRESGHGVYVVDVEARSGRVIHETDMKIIHPQFHRADPDIIEYAGDPCPRLWTIRRDGSENQCLYPSTDKEFFVHESFLGTSDDLIFTVWPYRLAKLNIHKRELETVAEINAWHMASSIDGTKIVCDTNHPDIGLLLIDPATGAYKPLCTSGSSNQGTQWQQDHPAGADVWSSIRGEKGETLSWMEMKVDNVYGPQWTHPHPAFDVAGARVVFTSDRTGTPQMYVVDVSQ